MPDFQNEYGQGNSGEFEYVDGLGGGINDNITYSWGPRLDQGLLIPQFDSPVVLANGTIVRGGDTSVYDGQPITPTAFNSNPDNLKDFYETGVTTINNLSIATGFNTGDFRLSLTDLRSDGIIPGVNLINCINVSDCISVFFNLSENQEILTISTVFDTIFDGFYAFLQHFTILTVNSVHCSDN